LTQEHRKMIAQLAVKHRLPTIYGGRELVEAGGLMFYGPSFADMYHRAATYVDKVLKGTKPTDLPVEQPTRFELVINLKAAKAIGSAWEASSYIRPAEVFDERYGRWCSQVFPAQNRLPWYNYISASSDCSPNRLIE
jgi:putative tryptophan/tyrosine transport system substrate-binding protein